MVFIIMYLVYTKVQGRVHFDVYENSVFFNKFLLHKII